MSGRQVLFVGQNECSAEPWEAVQSLLIEVPGIHLSGTTDLTEAIIAIEMYPFDLFLIDCMIDFEDGLTLWHEIRRTHILAHRSFPLWVALTYELEHFSEEQILARRGASGHVTPLEQHRTRFQDVVCRALSLR